MGDVIDFSEEDEVVFAASDACAAKFEVIALPATFLAVCDAKRTVLVDDQFALFRRRVRTGEPQVPAPCGLGRQHRLCVLGPD